MPYQVMAARYWPDAYPLGQRIQLGGPLAPWATIVGVAANSRQLAREEKARPLLYRPLLQSVRRKTDGGAAKAINREIDYVSLVSTIDGNVAPWRQGGRPIDLCRNCPAAYDRRINRLLFPGAPGDKG
jgi:hypothetical protein